METVTKKSDINIYLAKCLNIYKNRDLLDFIDVFHREILLRKVKFPLLEYVARAVFQELNEKEIIEFCDAIEDLKTEGGNVVLGIILQEISRQDFEQSMSKTVEYLSKADIWYSSDLIGERVFGVALLENPELMIPKLEGLSKNESQWVLRAIGAGTHYANKKGLDKKYASRMFELLLTLGNSFNKEVRSGIGWAAKTTAKFHPRVIESYQDVIVKTDNWFQRKVQIGLERNKHAKGN